MSRTARPIFPGEITIDTLPDLIAFHRATFGGMQMNGGAGGGQGAPAQPGSPTFQPPAPGTQPPAEQPPAEQPPARPDDVSEEEWNALGDPGRVALNRERDRRQAAERALAAAKARPTPPKPKQDPAGGQQPAQPAQPPAQPADGQPDIAALITQAVTAAIKPFQDREEQRDADAAAQRIADKVLDAAKAKFVDPTDALTGIDLTAITDGNGGADAAKITAALDDLLTRKPHLGKTIDGRRYAQPGGAVGALGTEVPIDQRVQTTLAQMQAAAGIKPTASKS